MWPALQKSNQGRATNAMNTLLACVILTFIIIHLKNIKGNGQMGCMRSPNDVSIQKGKRNHNGTVLTSIQGLEIQMCINICLKMTGCGSVNFDPKQWRCELMKAINDTGDIDVQYVVGSQSVTLLTVPSVARVSFNVRFYVKLVCSKRK